MVRTVIAWILSLGRNPRRYNCENIVIGLRVRGRELLHQIDIPAPDSREAFELLEDYEDWTDDT